MTHLCHWPGCKIEVDPVRWGCLDHWQKLPRELRQGIWRSYVPGQEIKKNPSPEYIEAAKAVRDWVLAQQAPEPDTEQLFADEPEQPAPRDERDPVAHIRHLPVEEQLKYCQARYVYPRQRQVIDPTGKHPIHSKMNWLTWWEQAHKQKLTDYIAYCKANYENQRRKTA